MTANPVSRACACLLALLLIGGAARAGSGADEVAFTLRILHLNDHHSHLESNPAARLVLDGESLEVETGGFPRVVTAFRELASRDWPTLKLHAGDAVTGTLYYTLFQGEADARLMNEVCFDAFVPGNHEFDDSDAGLARFLGALGAAPERCATSVVSANLRPEAGTPLWPRDGSPLIQPEAILNAGGQPVGIVGITIAGKTRQSSSPLPTTQLLDEVASAQQAIDRLREQGVNIVILLTHYQYTNDLILAAQLRGVDLIVGGDSHSLLGAAFAEVGLNPAGPYPTKIEDRDGRLVCVVQAWQYADVVGQLDADFDRDGQLLDCRGRAHLLLGEHFARDGVPLEGAELDAVRARIDAMPELRRTAPDPGATAILDTYRERVEQLKATRIGIAERAFCSERVPGQGVSGLCPVEATQANGGDVQQLIARAFLARSFEADIALQNAGAVRVDLPAGPLSVETAYRLMPFANTLVNLELSGAEIRQVLEEAVSSFIDATGSTGSYPYAANLRWTLDLSQPRGQRFSNLEIRPRGAADWRALRDDERVRVVTNSFLATGRDGYLTFGAASRAGRARDTFIHYAQGFIDYLQQDLGGAAPGDPLLTDPPRLGAIPCGDYSTQRFIDRDGRARTPDPTIGRACREEPVD